MIAPTLYTIRKFTFTMLLNYDFKINLSKKEEKKYYINQQDNMLFRQIRLITKNNDKYNPYIIFIDCKSSKKNEQSLKKLLKSGFFINDEHFIFTERSASMARNSILAFVNSKYECELNKRISMDLNIDKMVISKYIAYRGLMFSSCFCLEEWFPYIVVVDDYQKTIYNQNIKYMDKQEKDYIDNEGNIKKYTDKIIKEGYRDIIIEPFDGCGIHSPEITKEIKKRIGIEEDPTSVMWRAPFIKGVTHEVNFREFYNNKNIIAITDIWGYKHDIKDVQILITKSMYKGYKYFYNKGDINDWYSYWDKFKEYDHCIGIAKWNYSLDEEPIYTRSNYQILQDLELDYENFINLADDSLEWVDKIINGDSFYTYCFLGLFHNKLKPCNKYMDSILKNPEMLKEERIRQYLNNLLKKYIDEFKCGKLWLEGSFRILCPDLMMFMEYAGGISPKGILNQNEFYSKSRKGICKGKWLIERNPHICFSEHVILNGANNKIIEKYFGHLSGITMINSKSITHQRLNGADFDGDLVFTLKNEVMLIGADINKPIVIDVSDKVSVAEEEYKVDNIINGIILSMDNRIGEYSNIATCYHNKCPKTQEQKEKYMDFVNLVSVLNGKEIDYAKTGKRENLPGYISKYAKPLPYFMKYTGSYYKGLNKFNKSHSNMNRLCRDIEKWSKKIRFKNKYKDFDYTIMIDDEIDWNEDTYNKIKEIYNKFIIEMRDLQKQNNMKYYADNYQNYYGDLSKFEILNTTINWSYYYEKYKEQARKICTNQKELANYAVILCYDENKNKNKNFVWIVAGEGVVNNIKQVKLNLPIKDENGEYEYLGHKFNLKEYGGNLLAE